MPGRRTGAARMPRRRPARPRRPPPPTGAQSRRSPRLERQQPTRTQSQRAARPERQLQPPPTRTQAGGADKEPSRRVEADVADGREAEEHEGASRKKDSGEERARRGSRIWSSLTQGRPEGRDQGGAVASTPAASAFARAIAILLNSGHSRLFFRISTLNAGPKLDIIFVRGRDDDTGVDHRTLPVYISN